MYEEFEEADADEGGGGRGGACVVKARRDASSRSCHRARVDASRVQAGGRPSEPLDRLAAGGDRLSTGLAYARAYVEHSAFRTPGLSRARSLPSPGVAVRRAMTSSTATYQAAARDR